MSLQGVVQGAKIGIDLLGQIAGQKAQPLPGLHGGTGQHDTFDLVLLQHGERHGHGQIGLARPGGPHGKNELVTPQHFKIALLRHIARRDALAGRIDEHGLAEDLAQIQPRVAVQHGVAAHHVLPRDRHALTQQRIQLTLR